MRAFKPPVDGGLANANGISGLGLSPEVGNESLYGLLEIGVHNANYRNSYSVVNRDAYLPKNSAGYRLLAMGDTLQSRLKAARIEAGLTQGKVAQSVGISQPTYSDLETGNSQSSTLLPQIAFVLGVRPYWLATGKGPKKEGELLDFDERELIAAWRELPEESKSLVLTQFRALRRPA